MICIRVRFTDWSELKKWKDEEGQQTFAVSFKDYADMLFRKDAKGNVSPAGGFVINPYGGNIVVTKELAASFIAASIQRAQGQGGPGRPAPPERS